MELNNNTPNWNCIFERLNAASAEISGFEKSELHSTLKAIQGNWANLQKEPLSREGVRHIRPEQS